MTTWRLRRWHRALAGLAAAAVCGALLSACGGGGGYRLRAVFANAENLYAGNPVEVLGVREGTVTDVRAHGSAVIVTMLIDHGQRLPAGARATLANPQVLGTPSVELYPGYTGGPALAPDSTIPEQRTAVPVSVNRLLIDLQKTLHQIDPQAVGGFVSSLSQDLANQGAGLNQLISQGAGTLSLLASKGNQLGQLNGSLAAITGTLRQQSGQVTTLLQDYNTVAGVLAANRKPLGDAIGALASMSQQLATLLSPNLQPLQQDITTITQVGRTLDRNLPTIDQTLTASDQLFAGAVRAYDPVHNWLDLNLQPAPGLASAQEVGLIRDVLAGICRRIAAHHSSGLSPSQISTLQTCGNPASGFFDPILGLVPTLLSGGTAVGPTPQQMLSAGLAAIPGMSNGQRSQLSSLSPGQLAGTSAGGSGNATSGSGGASPSPGLHPAPPQQAPSSGGSLLGNLVHGLFGAVDAAGGLVRGIGGLL